MNPQRKRKAEADRAWEAIKSWVFFIRDRGKCVVCGKPAVTVHHAISKGSHPGLRLDKKNLFSVCPTEHGDNANTRESVKKFLEIGQAKFGYDYSELPYAGYL